MFPGEMVILMAIEVAGDSVKRLLNRPMDVSGQYINSLYQSLVRRGYLKGNKYRGYELTTMGRQALAEFLRRNESRVQDLVRTLEQLGIKTDKEFARTEKETAAVR